MHSGSRSHTDGNEKAHHEVRLSCSREILDLEEEHPDEEHSGGDEDREIDGAAARQEVVRGLAPSALVEEEREGRKCEQYDTERSRPCERTLRE